MSKPVQLYPAQWEKLRSKLKEDYPPSVIMIREKMKSVLGFVEREHRWYDYNVAEHRCMIMLDFYNEPKRTMFLLKYSEYVQR